MCTGSENINYMGRDAQIRGGEGGGGGAGFARPLPMQPVSYIPHFLSFLCFLLLPPRGGHRLK